MLGELYADWVSVLRQHAIGRELLDENLLPESSERVQVADLLEVPAATSIATKLAAGDAYKESPYALWHDLKLASGRRLASRDIGSPDYVQTRELVAAAVELLLNEAARLGLAGPTEPVQIGDPLTAHKLREGFSDIFADVQEGYGEAYFVVTQNGPLFTSQLQRAPQDPREATPGGSVHTTKLLPHVARAPTQVLGAAVPPPDSRTAPHPSAVPTDLLGSFVPFNRTPLVAARWVEPDVFASFTPPTDASDALVTADDAASVWLERANDLAPGPRPQTALNQPMVKKAESETGGNGQIAESAAESAADSASDSGGSSAGSSEGSGGESGPDSGAETDGHAAHAAAGLPSATKIPDAPEAGDGYSTVDEISELLGMNPQPLGQARPDLTGPNEGSGPSLGPTRGFNLPEGPDVDLEAVLQWTPCNFVDDDELAAAEAGKEPQLAAKLLLELQYLQRERLTAPGPRLEPGDRERHIALKAQNVLARLVGDVAGPAAVGGEMPSTKLPVLLRNYLGTLPAGDSVKGPPSGPPAATGPQINMGMAPNRLAGLDPTPLGRTNGHPGPGRPRLHR